MDHKLAGRILGVLLDLDRAIVGIKVLDKEEDLAAYRGRDLLRPMAYCVAVKSASLGHSIRMRGEDLGCSGGSRALGFSPAGQDFFTGRSGHGLGLYRSPEVASQVARSGEILEGDKAGLIIKPLVDFEARPDLALIIVNTREAMRIFQAYTYENGPVEGLKISGNQAVCMESTAYPLNTGRMNLSVFCSGTRHQAGWSQDQLLVSLPMDKLDSLIRGLKGTVNAIEYNDRKEEIERGLRELDSLDFDLDYTRTYFANWGDSHGK